MATVCGTCMVGEGNPVIAAMRSRICFSVRFSPPKMYRSPEVPRSSAATCMAATACDIDQVQAGIHIRGKFSVKKIDDNAPGRCGLASFAPIGVVGFRMTTRWPRRAAAIASCSARNFERL